MSDFWFQNPKYERITPNVCHIFYFELPRQSRLPFTGVCLDLLASENDAVNRKNGKLSFDGLF